ncbi:MAG: hypothetical protein ABI603_15090 [Acidobacteriota bacterium]
MRRPRAIACSLSALLWPIAAAAQTPAVARPLGQCPVADAALIPALTGAFEAGDAPRFRIVSASVVEAARRCPPVDPADRTALESIDLRSDTLVVVWPAWPASTSTGEAVLHTAVLRRGAGLYDRSLGGVGAGGGGRLFQIFLTASAGDRLTGVYVSERESGPLEARLPAFVAAIAAPLLAAVAAAQGTIAGVREAAEIPPAWLSVARVDLPFRRASVQMALQARVAPTAAVIAQRAETLRRRMVFVEAPHVACAAGLADALADAIREIPAVCAGDPRGCVEAAADSFATLYDRQETACRGATAADTTRNRQALQRVDAAFRGLTLGLEPAVLTASARLRNAPHERFSLGVATAYLVAARSRSPRATLSRGVIVADPPVRQASLVLVNGAFRTYDAARPAPGWSERLRWFAGAVVAPDIGAAAGLSLLVVRGLAINVGGAALAIRTPAPGETLGQPPVRPARPFSPATIRSALIGVSFNFK